MKFDSNFYMGIISLILFSICGVLSVNGNVWIIILSVFLFLIVSAVIMALYTLIIPKKLKIQVDWSIFLPFSIMLLLSRIFLGWNIFVPFITAAFLALTINCIHKNKLSGKNAAVLFLIGGLSSLVYVLVSVSGGNLV